MNHVSVAVRIPTATFLVAVSFLILGGTAHAQAALSLGKYVSVNNSSFYTSENANPGDTLTYAVEYANHSGTAATSASITDVLASGQTLMAVSAGCTVTGSTVTCLLGTVPTYPSNGYTGIVFIEIRVNSTFAGTISNTAVIHATNATNQSSNTTSVAVSGIPSGVTLQKWVSVDGDAYTTSAAGTFGDTLTYKIEYTNTSGGTIPGVNISDILQPGQTLSGFPSTSNCSYDAGTRTVSCLLGSVSNNTVVTEYVQTTVTTSGPALIGNQATATWGSTSTSSNATSISVATTAPPFGIGATTICGVITAYTRATSNTTGSITIGGLHFVIAAGASVVGILSTSGNECVGFTFNGSAYATTLVGTSNLSLLAAACGVYTPSTTSGDIVVGGVTVTVAAGAGFNPFLQSGGYYCVLLNNTGQAYAVISGIPTSAQVQGSPGSARFRELDE